MKFNIIAIFFILCFFKINLCFLRHYSPDATLIGNNGIRFMQKASTNTEEEIKENNQGGYKYTSEVIVVKETDPADSKPLETKGKVVLEKRNVNLLDLATGKVKTSLNYLE